ncbi:lauroyl-Kdo(2)-lipid IV(A) myristoyltransferase, partial [Salmonella enterica subsp. enterica]|nr:lauroyl-Kdo(2)-lipid IV(A) myristoyltransferase [Salmonella enterica subsp. enterica]
MCGADVATLFTIPFRVSRPWKSMETKKNNSEYIPEFEKSFRYPQYWGAWL